MSEPLEHIKHREILFRGPHHEPHQAQAAALILSNVEGVLHIQPAHPELLHVSYDVTLLTLRVIEELLVELGFHLDNNLMIKLRRALYYYSEEAQQEQLGCRRGHGNCTEAIFIEKYQQRPHGCRDGRPEHWRRYL
ncbi:hypothetical protein [Thiohalobacter thiocyanaticus]|uniref:Uncharacterized protein n=1 Tax=Thiohalobacter thiocyanaticus TaxID=585455 RepID=A0A426QKU3_9GAMM|nr:hypothetical protein [Thiohalobacter thiocyanaticus]RRQ22379.1 hypothetical protein D6C00_10725 [Thiohalobacter thiocyanaticus]